MEPQSFSRASPIRSRRSSPKASPARAPAPPSFTPMPMTAAGPQIHDWQVYARIIEGIRNQVDVPVYPSYPAFTTDGQMPRLQTYPLAIAHIEALVERGLLEFALIDPGSVNLGADNDNIGRQAGRHLPESRRPCPVCARLCRSGMGSTRISRSTNPASCAPARCWLARSAPGLPSTVSCSATRSRSAFRQSLMRYRLIWRCWRRKRPARTG